MNLQFDVVMLEVLLNLFSIDIIHIQIGHGQDPTPGLVTRGKLAILRVENSIKEGEVVRDLLVPLNMKPVLGRNDRGLHVGHVEEVETIVGEVKRFGGRWLMVDEALGAPIPYNSSPPPQSPFCLAQANGRTEIRATTTVPEQ